MEIYVDMAGKCLRSAFFGFRQSAILCSRMSLPSSIRGEFPILTVKVGSEPLAYVDNAATTQKPRCVLDAMTEFYETKNANINRGVHPLAEAATVAYDDARNTVADFIGARSHEIIFTRNCTEAINLVAKTWGASLKKTDGIALSAMEHHGNIVPWMQTGAALTWISVNADGQPNLDELEAALKTKKIKLVAMTGLSNVLGSLPPLKKIIALAHEHGALTLVDAAQLIAHDAIDVQELDCDFLAFSGHKVYGPTGIGVLYGKAELLKKLPPFLGGGDMIASVTTEGFEAAELPRRFEAGTPAIAEAVGLAAALDWVKKIGIENIATHERALLAYAQKKLATIDGLTMLGPKNSDERAGCISFTVKGMHPHDLTEALGRKGICLRAGHHCTEPLHRALKLNATARLSVAAYNTKEEIDRCVAAIEDAKTFFTK